MKKRRGRPKKTVEEGLTSRSLNTKFMELDEQVDLFTGTVTFEGYGKRYCSNIIDDEELKELWHKSKISKEDDCLMGIGKNIINQTNKLNPTSPVRSAVLGAATIGIIHSFPST